MIYRVDKVYGGGAQTGWQNPAESYRACKQTFSGGPPYMTYVDVFVVCLYKASGGLRAVSACV